MSGIVVVAVVWVALVLPVALVIGRLLRTADLAEVGPRAVRRRSWAGVHLAAGRIGELRRRHGWLIGARGA